MSDLKSQKPSDPTAGRREIVARALHAAHIPFCDYTYPYEHEMSSRYVYETLADAVIAVDVAARLDLSKLREWADDFEAAAHDVPRGIKSTILMTRAQEVRAILAAIDRGI